MRLDNKVAIVTGAGKGIGEAIAKRFAEEGARVVICDVIEGELKRVETDLSARGYPVLSMVIDVSKRPQVDEMVLSTLKRFGTIDILVNNAGINRDAMIHKMSESDWDLVMDTNLKGCFNCCQSVVNVMRDKGYGKIINISAPSCLGSIGQANYSASKAGIDSLTRTLAKELGAKSINVNAIAPGSIETEMFQSVSEKLRQMALYVLPLKRFGSSNEVANLCLFLASDEASFITGQIVNCDGGMFMG